jgi:hemerythrin-like domain-containing protein
MRGVMCDIRILENGDAISLLLFWRREGFMPIPATNVSIANQLKKEHSRIDVIVRKIEKLVASIKPQRRALEWSSSLLENLSSLREHLEKHFEFEESGGFMEEVMKALPNMSPQVEALHRDHEILTYEINDLYRRAERLILDNGPTTREIGEDIRHFLHSLREHERKENALVLRVFLDDVGMID